MPSWTTPPPHTPKRCREDVEADVRVLMSKHAAIGDRGFDSAAQRKILRDRIDRYLDEHSSAGSASFTAAVCVTSSRCPAALTVLGLRVTVAREGVR